MRDRQKIIVPAHAIFNEINTFLLICFIFDRENGFICFCYWFDNGYIFLLIAIFN